MPAARTLQQLNQRIVDCERCPRLRAHCRQVAQVKRAQYRDQAYFGKPVPNFLAATPPEVGLLIIGLAPAAHGGNRTGRMFTGDRSGDFLYRAMHEAGFANQPTSRDASDGLALRGALVTAACHCAPPDNKPTPDELANCSGYLDQTFDAAPHAAVVLCLGRIAFDAVLRLLQRRGWIDRPGRFGFTHGAEHRIEHPPGASPKPSPEAPREVHRRPVTVLCSYHPSQQNTFTGRLTPEMMRRVFERARTIIEDAGQA